ncbi:MAG: UDP-4-amino-4-deoxy-L-arabinose-oxoglutarate aminotransferase [candidate division NC10 bacterium RIFCSPLOWO2_02_FULL_66_22]|nr:MAG: UDP-4-amino-4-deoxy-L-arabinose-oxoglutarate aminotransferase [candidate division NC10 bacterium RIFCSPLOWO2_02_FULL_66_22]
MTAEPVLPERAKGEPPGLAVSVVIPVYNEEANLERLCERLQRVLEDLGRPHEVIFVDDGSRDRSLEILCRLQEKHGTVRVIQLNRNYGQHAAVFAGLDHARGDVIVTLDADLQNPPEEIPRLLDKISEGHDVVGGWRQSRRDHVVRRLLSWGVNKLTSKVVGVEMRDYGCMLRAYRREVVEVLRGCSEVSSFIPALANTFAGSPTEIPVTHDRRLNGRSKYNLFRLIRLNFDLMTGFSLLPIQVVSLAGIGIAVLGLGFGGFLMLRRLLMGPESEGVFTLFAILFFFVGIQVLALGLIGEYIGRIYMEVRRRPRYVIRRIYE